MIRLNRFSLADSLHLEPGEGRALFLLCLSLVLVTGSTAVIGRTVSRSLFLSGLPRQYIPVRYLTVTVGVVLTSPSLRVGDDSGGRCQGKCSFVSRSEGHA